MKRSELTWRRLTPVGFLEVQGEEAITWTELLRISARIPGLDQVLIDGAPQNRVTLVKGPPGSGKTTFGLQFLVEGARQGGAGIFIMLADTEREIKSFAASLELKLDGISILEMLSPEYLKGESQTFFRAAELSPGEFACKVRAVVEEENCRMVVIDSLTGYLNALPEERSLMLQLHELGAYLKQRKVITFMVLYRAGLLGSNVQSQVDLNYLSDAVILFRAFEALGSVRVALSVVKKRYGAHERTIRELLLEPGRIRVGPVLRDFEGVLTGNRASAVRLAHTPL